MIVDAFMHLCCTVGIIAVVLFLFVAGYSVIDTWLEYREDQRRDHNESNRR